MASAGAADGGFLGSSVDSFITRTASAEPVPGGGSVAAVTAALGISLIRMALAVTGDETHAEAAARAEELGSRACDAADRDAQVFEELMSAYRSPAPDKAMRVREASVNATEVPLALAEVCLDALRLADSTEPVVKRRIVSDVRAGRGIVVGATLAALETAHINIDALRASEAPEAEALLDRYSRAQATLAELMPGPAA